MVTQQPTASEAPTLDNNVTTERKYRTAFAVPRYVALISTNIAAAQRNLAQNAAISVRLYVCMDDVYFVF